MTAADLAAVMAIERQNPGPWNTSQLADELGQSLSWQWIARSSDSERVLGYIIGRTVADEAEILRLAVDAKHRRCGVAQHLLQHTFTELRRNGTLTCFLELRVGNIGARRLYEKNGFQSIGIRYNYYQSPDEDAFVMTKSLQE